MTLLGRGGRARRLFAPAGVAAGAASTACGAALWLAGQILPFEPPVHAWLLVAGALFGFAGLVLQVLDRWTWAAGTLAVLGLVLAAGFLAVLVGPVRLSARVVEPAGAATPPLKPQRLRVVSYNVLHGYPRFTDQEARFAALSDELARLDPDVALLQEAWCTRRHGCAINRLATGRGPFRGYHLAYTPVNGSLRLIGFEEGLAVASRWPIESVRVAELRPRERAWRRRGVLEVTVRLDGAAWTFVTAHLTNLDDGNRAAQARDLASRLPVGGPLLLGADLNAPASSPVVSTLVEAGLETVLAGERDHVLLRSLPRGWRLAEAGWGFAGAAPEPHTGQRIVISDHAAAWVELVRGGA